MIPDSYLKLCDHTTHHLSTTLHSTPVVSSICALSLALPTYASRLLQLLAFLKFSINLHCSSQGHLRLCFSTFSSYYLAHTFHLWKSYMDAVQSTAWDSPTHNIPHPPTFFFKEAFMVSTFPWFLHLLLG